MISDNFQVTFVDYLNGNFIVASPVYGFMKSHFFLLLLIPLFFTSCGVKKSLEARPDLSDLNTVDTIRTKHDKDFYTVGKNSLRKNKNGLWELYVEGNALQRGYAIGSLSRELIKTQQSAFMEKVTSMVDSPSYFKFLSKVVAWFNRKLYLNVPEEYKEEIYGISRFSSHEYDDFAKPYVRNLYLHGAHDIGHALQDLMLVGCSSFAVKDKKTTDGGLLIGRNFDFYVNDDFDKNKIIAFINPKKGHKFMIYTWPGFIGAVSGMNDKGLTVTLNAAKSKIPLVAKDPISLVAREILQYAENTKQAIAIAKKRQVFVSESIMIGSAEDHKAIIIEVSPNDFGVYDVPNSDELLCTNHFQSLELKDNPRNVDFMKKGNSVERYERLGELLNRKGKLNPQKAVKILRNRKGYQDETVGYGNELALNQLLAHHGIIFKPEEHKVWVSSNPYNMGAYLCYDLDEVFKKFKKGDVDYSVAIDSLEIPKSPFLETQAYKKYEEFRVERQKLKSVIKSKKTISQEELNHFEWLNPDFWETYYLVGKYHYENKQYKKAVVAFKQALKREVTTLPDKKLLKKYIRKSYRKF